jgi:hypothetical protein
MSRKPRTVEAVRDEIISAVTEVRSVARSEQDNQRAQAANWLDEQFAGITNRRERELRGAASYALGSLYRGGMGSFQDVGTEASSRAVKRLYRALRRGRSWFLRNW